MHRLFMSSVAAAACIAAIQAVKPAAAEDEPLSACKATAARYVAAIGSGNPDKVAALFTKTGTLNAPEGIFQGTAAIAAFDRGYVTPGVSQTVSPSHGERIGKALICSGQYVVTFAPGFPMKQAAGYYSALHVEDGGAWPHALLAYNYTPPPMPPQGQ